MDHDDRAEQYRYQDQRSHAREETGDEGEAAQGLESDRQIGEGSRQAEACKELRRPGRREDEDLQTGMGEKE